MNFITGQPKSGPQQHYTILVIVDSLTKMAHYIPMHESVTLEGTAHLSCDNIFRLQGLPDSLVSDRGTQRVNAILEQYLRGNINYQQDAWTEILTMTKFAYNNTVSATTGITPFFALYGQHPQWIIKQNPATKTPTPAVLEEWGNQLDNLNTYQKSEMVHA